MTDQPRTLDLTPSPRLLEVLGDIPYTIWQCIAELVDNAFDNFRKIDTGDPREICVTLPKPTTEDWDAAEITVADTGTGMSTDQLQNALRAGYSDNDRYGSLGLFGMGFNIATARLGRITTVKTTQAGEETWTSVTIDFHEMQRSGSFAVNVTQTLKDDPEMHGTEFTVSRLQESTISALRKSNTIGTVRNKLADVYSVLLREGEAIPGIETSAGMNNPASLYINDKKVLPSRPCVWSPSRTTQYEGVEVAAVRAIDHELAPARACQECGHWHPEHYTAEECASCGRRKLELRERRIYGWLGVRRYLDSNFGISFIRNGRKILTDDRSLFSWENPDTGEQSVEYPLEPPANQGRIVGEIHLDHVPVTYQKNDFERGSHWATAVNYLRGIGPIRPQYAKRHGYEPNTSPLGLLVRAFQKNDPGVKYLTPGDGSKAMHEKAREWARAFNKGEPEFQSDEKWYQQAAKHDAIKHGTLEQDSTAEQELEKLKRETGLPLPPNHDSRSTPQAPRPVPELAESEDTRFRRYQENSVELVELDGKITFEETSRQLKVYSTASRLRGAAGEDVPTVTRTQAGGVLTVFVNSTHPIFTEYGHRVHDHALWAAAETLRAHAESRAPLARVVAEIIRSFPDLRLTARTLHDRADTLLARVQEATAQSFSDDPEAAWSVLTPTLKTDAESAALQKNSAIDWANVTKTSEFFDYLGYEAFARITEVLPERMLDGQVFRTSWQSWTDERVRNRAVTRLARLLADIGEFVSASPRPHSREMQRIQLILDELYDQVEERA